MQIKYKICNLTPIQIEILQQKECYMTTVSNLWQSNYIWTVQEELYKSIFKEYKKDEIINLLLTEYDIKHLIDCGIPKSKITKKEAIYQIINEANNFLEDLQLNGA